MFNQIITKTLLLFWKEEHNPKFKPQNMPSSLQLHRINPTNPTTNPSTTPNCHKKSHQPEFTIPKVFIPLESLSVVPNHVVPYHSHMILPNQCSSSVVQTIEAPVSTVWSIIRCFDKPQVYKHFLKSCHVIVGNGDVGTVREVHVVSGLPAGSSMERLEMLDEERHILSFSIVGGDHRLENYRSVTTLHATACGGKTVVVESYVVDIPSGNTWDDTCVFLDTIVRCNLQSLARICQYMAKGNTDKNSW